jgi:hypothetical protein
MTMFIIYVKGKQMEKELLVNMIRENKSLIQISKITGKSLTSIRYWVAKYELGKINNINCFPSCFGNSCETAFRES